MSVDEWSYRPKETSKPPPGSGFEVFWVLLDACWVLVWCLLGAAPVHSYALLCTMRAGALGVGWSLARTHEPAGGHTGESFQTHTRTHTHAHKRAPFVVVVGVIVVVVLVVVVVAVAVFVVLVVVVVVVVLLVVNCRRCSCRSCRSCRCCCRCRCRFVALAWLGLLRAYRP